MRRDCARRRVGAAEQDDKSSFGDMLEVCLQAADMVTAANADRDDRVFDEAGPGDRNRSAYKPGPRQVTSIPGQRRTMISENTGFTDRFHRPLLDGLEVGGEQSEPVGGMPKQVAFQKHFGHIARAIFRETAGHQERLAEALQVCGVEFTDAGVCAQRHGLQGELQRGFDRLGEMKM